MALAASVGLGACSKRAPETAGQEQPASSDPNEPSAGAPAPADSAAEPPPRAPLRLEPKTALTTTAGLDIALVDLVVESIEPDPDNPDEAGGDGVIATLQVGDERVTLSELPKGYSSQRDVWTRGAHVWLAEMGGPPSPFVAFHADRITGRVAAGSEREVVVKKKESVEIGPDAHLVFLGHGHKTVSAGQRSPLIVAVAFVAGQNPPEEESYNLDPPDDARFKWRDYVFDLTAHDYDQSMTLELHRLETEPLRAAP